MLFRSLWLFLSGCLFIKESVFFASYALCRRLSAQMCIRDSPEAGPFSALYFGAELTRRRAPAHPSGCPACAAGCPRSVSYTHLDVYKRQLQGSSVELGMQQGVQLLGLHAQDSLLLLSLIHISGKNSLMNSCTLRSDSLMVVSSWIPLPSSPI